MRLNKRMPLGLAVAAMVVIGGTLEAQVTFQGTTTGCFFVTGTCSPVPGVATFLGLTFTPGSFTSVSADDGSLDIGEVAPGNTGNLGYLSLAGTPAPAFAVNGVPVYEVGGYTFDANGNQYLTNGTPMTWTPLSPEDVGSLLSLQTLATTDDGTFALDIMFSLPQMIAGENPASFDQGLFGYVTVDDAGTVQINFGGPQTFSGDGPDGEAESFTIQVNPVSLTPGGPAVAITDGNGSITSTPEPASLGLLFTGLVGLAGFARRRGLRLLPFSIPSTSATSADVDGPLSDQ